MRRMLFFIVFGFFLSGIPQRVYAEEIKRYQTDVEIYIDGTIRVQESVSYDFGSLDRHGIFRNIPFIKTNEDGKKFRLKYSDVTVTNEKGDRYKVATSYEDGYLKLKIGDPDQTITGEHIYNISYSVSGALTYFSDHIELYWNITGNEWEVPIKTAAATITLPDTVPRKDIKAVCYTGPMGSKESSCSYTIASDVDFRTASSLNSTEGLTIVVSFPRGIISVLEPEEYVEFWDTPFGQFVAGVLIVLGIIVGIVWYGLAPGYIIYRWYLFGRDPRPPMGVASAWFEAPKTQTGRKLMPGETGSLIDERADLRDIFATIVDLARRGYLKIIENKKNDYSLMKLKDEVAGEKLRVYEQLLLDGLFSSGDLLKLKGADLVSEIQKVQDSIYVSLVDDDFFNENPKKVRDIYSIIAGVAFFTANFPLFLICVTFGLSMPRKTMRGAQESAVAQSLKNFLSSQEQKLEFQAKNFMYFEKFLPYAIAFGVERIWAERFRDIDMKPPDWYVSSRPGGSFQSYSFVNSLNSSFTNVSSAATPSRSSSGFSSGFGGGSGGGGGGGGGGSW